MTTEPVKRVGSSENILLSLGNQENEKKYFWVKPLRTFPELHVLQIPSDKKTFQRNAGLTH